MNELRPTFGAARRRALRAACAVLLAALPALGNDTPWPAAPTQGDAARGKALVGQHQCGRCHRIPGVAGAVGTLGPSLDAAARRSYLAGEVPNTRELRARWVRDAPSLVPGTAMPSLGVAEADARAIADYLATLH